MNKFAKNTLFTATTKFFQLLIGILISIIIARALGPFGNGIYSLTILLPAFLIIIIQFGMGHVLTFYTSQGKYPLKNIFGLSIVFSAIASFLAAAVGLTIILFFADKTFPDIKTSYLLLALILIPFEILLTFLIGIILGLQDIKRYNLIQLFQTAFFLFLAFFLLLGGNNNIMAVVLAEAVSLFAACIFSLIYIKHKAGGISFCLKKEALRDFLSYGARMHLGNIASFLFLRIDIWMIGILLNPVAVGFYSIAVALSERVWLISKSAGLMLFPKVSSEKDELEIRRFTPVICRNVIFVTLIMAGALFLTGEKLIVLFYSESFLPALNSFKILLIGAIAISGNRILTYDFAGRGKPGVNTWVAIIGLILNVILNLVLIPKRGIEGAAWSSVVSYSAVFLIKMFLYARISNNRLIDLIFIKGSDIGRYRRLADLK